MYWNLDKLFIFKETCFLLKWCRSNMVRAQEHKIKHIIHQNNVLYMKRN